MNSKRQKNKDVLRSLVWKIIEVTIQHPFTYVKILIQIGYEPYPPRLETFFGKTYLALPNAFTYLDYIASVDGTLGCFRGLIPNICCTIVTFLVSRIMMYTYYDNIFPPQKNIRKLHDTFEHGPNKYNNKIKLINKKDLHHEHANNVSKPVSSLILKQTLLKLIGNTYGIFASHPFYVIMVRSMAEFVGREKNYTSLKASALEIYKNHGSAGFFKGVLARLLADYISILVPAISVLIVSKIRNRSSWLAERIVDKTACVLATRLTNKLDVVTCNRAVNNSGLLIGQPPYTIFYENSLACWQGLSSLNQLNRGYFKCGRSYEGPKIEVNGKQVPDGFMFGPIHPYNLGILE